MKSLRTKILVTVGGVAILAMIISAVITLTNVSKESIYSEKYVARVSTQVVAEQLNEYFTKYISVTQQVANNNMIKKICQQSVDEASLQANPLYADTLASLQRTQSQDPENILSIYFVKAGQCVGLDQGEWIPGADFDLTQKEYWFDTQDKIDKGYIIAEPYQDSDTGNMVITISAPLYDVTDTKVLGVVAIDVKINDLSKMVVNSESTYDTAYKLLLSSKGDVIASGDKEQLLKNVSDLGYSDNMIEEVANASGEVFEFKDNGGSAYGVIETTDAAKWRVAYIIPEKEFMEDTNSILRTTIIVYVLAIIALVIVTLIVTKSVVAPLRKLNLITQELAAGNLDTEVDIVSADETGQLAESMRALVGRLSEYIDYIDEVSAALDRFSTGHLDINLTQSYDGEFAKIKTSLLEVSRVFKDTIGQIVETSQRVASGSGEIANAAQMLAQGATNQASTTEELTATINELSDRVTKNADHAKNAAQQVQQVGGTADMSNEQMKEMIEAIAEINEKSSEIGKIIKTIEDIAFQTNILALNAAVEAARAGEAGKGFAVVADEVRNLASKSAEAAKDTTHLIEETIKAVENGTEIANKTGEMLGEVIEGVSQTVGLIQEISDASSSQADALKQTLDGVEEISTVTQTNAATAEESSAASDELSKQANALQGVASQFKL